MELPWLSRWQPQMLAILRIVVALLFIEHATIKLLGFPPGGQPGLQDVGSFLWVAGLIELVTGVLVQVARPRRRQARQRSSRRAKWPSHTGWCTPRWASTPP